MIGYEIDGKSYGVLTEEDFYPPEDERCYRSGVDYVLGDIDYYGYARTFWDMYGEDLYDDPLSYGF